MKFRFERQKNKERSASEAKAQESLALAKELTPYSEEEHYTYEDLREALKEITLALEGDNKQAAYQATEDLIKYYGEKTCNLGTLRNQLKQEVKDTKPTETEQQARRIAKEQQEISKKAQTLADTENPETFITSLKEKLKHFTDKAKYAAAIAALAISVGAGSYVQAEEGVRSDTLQYGDISDAESDIEITHYNETTELKAQAEQLINLYNDEGFIRNSINKITRKTSILTDSEKLLLHQQIDQRYPDQVSFEEMLTEYEKAEDKNVDFFWKDVWEHANPETRMKLIYTIVEKGIIDEGTSYRIAQEVGDYYFYPDAKNVFNVLLEKHPSVLLETGFIHKNIPTEYVVRMIEEIPFTAFQKYIDNFKFKALTAVSTKAFSDILTAIVGKIKEELPISTEILKRQEENMSDHPSVHFVDWTEEFLRDPALLLTKDINPSWIPAEDVNSTDAFYLAEHQLMIARNMYFEGVQNAGGVTEDMVKQASKEIIQRRAEVRDTPLFKNREVVVLAGNEIATVKGRDNEVMFGREDTLEEVRRQMAVSVDLFSPDKEHMLNQLMSISEIEQIKQEVEALKKEGLDQIASTAGKLTIMLEGHGSPDGKVHLIGGYHAAMQGGLETWNCVTAGDLADALNKRWHLLEKQIASGDMLEQEAREPVIITFMSCFGSNYIRSLYNLLNPEVPKPYCIAGSEYGQVMYGYDSIFSSTHTEGSVLQIEKGGPATMGGAVEETMRKESLYQKSNPVIYVPKKDFDPDKEFDPEKDNVPMQISMGEMPDSAEGAV